MNGIKVLVVIIITSWLAYQIGFREGYDHGLAAFLLTHGSKKENKKE